ncbi:SMC6 [Sanghuangporus sanghuang]
MRKRRVSDDDGSDAETAEILSSTKRQRVDDDDDHVREEETEEDKHFEATYRGKVLASIEAKQRYKGRIAEYGIIQSLELQQFMCHSRLSFVFGPQINFIIGHNGSGKSAVLTALTIALGGKAAVTGRGSGLKSFIQEGKTWAEVTVAIKNEGDEAYKSEIYGKSIIVTRNFTKSGSSSYKIKSKDGKTISTKKDELARILDHMNIQVDNPMNILTQDSARQFIGGTHPTDKYEFFLKGTQLKQLSEEYETCLENIGKTYKILEAKREALPDLKRAVVEANNRYKAAQRAVQTRERLDELKQEQAWAHVAAKEDQMRTKIEEVAKKTRKLPKFQEKVDAAKKDFAGYSEKIATLENEIKDLGDIDHLNSRKTELNDQMRANKTRIRSYQTNEREMTIELNTANSTIKDLNARIDTETSKLQEDKKAEQEERHRKMEAAKQAINGRELRRSQINDEMRQIDEGTGPLKMKIAQSETVMQNSHSGIQHCSRQLHDLNQKAAGFDRLKVFGKNLPQVHDQIERMQWNGKKPIGPLGMYVSLDDKKWAPVLRAIVGNLMTSFAVTDPRDRPILRKLLVDSRNTHMQVVVADSEEFDYRSGEPPEDKLTVLRALKFRKFSNEYVKRIFINSNRIERTFLADTRAKAERMAEEERDRKVDAGGVALSADLYRVTAYSDGGSYSQPVQELRGNDPRKQFFAYNDPEGFRKHWEEQKQAAEKAFKEAKATVDASKQELDCLNRQRAILTNDARAIENELFIQKQTLRNLQNQLNDDVPVNIASLEEALKEAEETRENVIRQFRDLETAKSEIEQQQRPLLEEANKIKAQIDAFEAKRSDLTNEVVEASGKRSRAQEEMRRAETKLKEEQARIEEMEEAARLLQEEYENWTRQAEEFCHGRRVDNPRKVTEVERELKSVDEALKQQEREQGASVEELEEALIEAKRKHKEMEQDLKDLTTLNKMLKSSLNLRLQRWHDFRRHIALRTKLQFQHNLANRGYFGKVLFDHEKQKLELKVQTDDAAATQGLNKDPKSLSGGEKSFSTICLLLALWEAIGCPIRCLDEFDVFMDAVNRRISMKMMIDTANASDSKQYILITPQDMSSVSFGPSVRVHRMSDPERGQTTLG